jgi:hypothetical protein
MEISGRSYLPEYRGHAPSPPRLGLDWHRAAEVLVLGVGGACAVRGGMG